MKLIRKGHHNNPIIAALVRANIGQPDKLKNPEDKYDYPIEFNRQRLTWVYADNSVFYKGCDVGNLNCRGIWVDPVKDREKLVQYISTAPERETYPNGDWVFGTNIHNTVTVRDFDRAIQ